MSEQPALHRALERLLVEFDRVCDELGIAYYLIGGSCLGAIRHKGFIPWDDDVDVVMSREDFARLEQEGAATVRQGFTFHTRAVDPILGAEGKLYLDDTKAPSTFGDRRRMRRPVHPGVFLDILVEYPVALSRWRRQVERCGGWLVYVKPWASSLAKAPEESRSSRALWAFAGAVPAPLVSWVRVWLLRSNRQRSSPLLGFGLGAANSVIYERDSIYPLQRRAFAGTTALTPGDAHRFLVTAIGADYMTLPPESQRVFHSDGIELGD